MSTAEVLRSAREEGGLSIRRLAEQAEVSPSTVWRIEAGRLDPTVTMLEKLLAAAHPQSLTPRTREADVSLALGRLTAAEVLRRPEPLLEKAQQRVSTALDNADLPPGTRRWTVAWRQLLDGPFEDVIAALIDPSEVGYELRQNTPFTGVLSEEDRLTAIRETTRERRAARSA